MIAYRDFVTRNTYDPLAYELSGEWMLGLNNVLALNITRFHIFNSPRDPQAIGGAKA